MMAYARMEDFTFGGFAATWGDILYASLQNLWLAFLGFFPRLVGALVAIIVGWILAVSLGALASRIIQIIKLDDLADRLEIRKAARRAGIDLSISGLVGWFVKWFILLTFFISAVDILEWSQVNLFLNQVALYVPNVAVAVIILLAGFVLGKFVRDVVDGAVRAAKLRSGHFFAGVAQWSIFVFAAAAALVQLGVASALVQIFMTGLVAMVALAGGLAFGLGGRAHAERLLDRIRKDLSE